MDVSMKFSLVLATLDTDEAEFSRFLVSLKAQLPEMVELILVDQNPDDRLQRWTADYQGLFPIKIVRSLKGAARARNVGLPEVSGDVVVFPDDDCWYPPGLLRAVRETLEANPQWGGVTGSARDGEGRPAVGNWQDPAGQVTKFNVWERGVAVTIFLRKAVLQKIGGFDEDLGVGSSTPWQSGEETDLLIRALEVAPIYFRPELITLHDSIQVYNRAENAKAYRYALGCGYVLRKHRYPLWFLLYKLARSTAATVLSFLRGRPGKAGYHIAIFKGRLRGYLRRP